jgi:hypothetical protein
MARRRSIRRRAVSIRIDKLPGPSGGCSAIPADGNPNDHACYPLSDERLPAQDIPLCASENTDSRVGSTAHIGEYRTSM